MGIDLPIHEQVFTEHLGTCLNIGKENHTHIKIPR